MKRSLFAALFAFAVAAAACDDKSAADAKPQPDAPPKVTASARAAAPPAADTLPSLNVDEAAATLAGMRIDFSGDARGKLTAALEGSPKVRGSMMPVEAMRNATMPRVSTALAALKAAGARGAVLRTATRERSVIGELVVEFDAAAPAPCSVVAMVGKDSAITVWAAGGGSAQRFAHGMAGPDLTLGSEGMRKASASCDSQVYFLGADDAVKWGLVFDLALAARAFEAGAMRATQARVLLSAPSPARKLRE